MTSSMSYCTGAFIGVQYYFVNKKDLVNVVTSTRFIQSQLIINLKSEHDTKNSGILGE